MNKKRYETTVRFFSENKIANTILLLIYKALPYFVFVAYPALLIFMFFQIGYGIEWQKMILVPLGVLILVKVLRVVINEERPYEKYGMDSVFHKTTVHKSMPSRHTASAYIIAMTFLSVNVNSEPLPGSLFTEMSPPISCVTSFAMDRPRPVPVVRMRERSAL